MKLILDNIIFNLQKSGGISVYWFEIVEKILKLPDFKSFFIERNEVNTNIFRKELKIHENNIINAESSNIGFLSRYRPIKLNIKDEKFIFHSSYYRTLRKKIKKNNNVKEVVTVHDFTYEHFNKGLKKWVHSYQKKKAIDSADVVICISQNTKRDLLYFYPEFSNKDIRVVYNGVSSDYFTIPGLTYEKNISPFFLFIGSRAGYKNFDFTVKAISQTKDFFLKIVGGELSKKEIILLNEFLPDRWEFLNNINNKELNKLYNTTFALIYPSSYEGFGIPIVEAMKAGCPFIALKKSSIPEVAGNAGVLMEGLEMSFFNEAVFLITNNRSEIINKGFIQVNKFSWNKCFDETINIYKQLNNSF